MSAADIKPATHVLAQCHQTKNETHDGADVDMWCKNASGEQHGYMQDIKALANGDPQECGRALRRGAG